MDAVQHIEITPGVCGGKPRIAGTRVRVQDIVVWHDVNGESADEIVAACPSLTLADVHAAMTYYYDHIAKINEQIAQSDALIDAMKKRSSTDNDDARCAKLRQNA